MKELNQREMAEHFQRIIYEHIKSEERLRGIQRRNRFWAGAFYSGCTVIVLVPVIIWILT